MESIATVCKLIVSEFAGPDAIRSWFIAASPTYPQSFNSTSLTQCLASALLISEPLFCISKLSEFHASLSDAEICASLNFLFRKCPSVLHEESLRGWVLTGRVAALQFLLERGFRADASESEALRIASGQGNTDAVRLLAMYGASVNARSDQALLMAASNGHVDTVECLFELGATIPEWNRQHQWRQAIGESLKKAAGEGDIPALNILILLGAVDALPMHTAVAAAALSKQREVVRILLAEGALKEYVTGPVPADDFMEVDEAEGRQPPAQLSSVAANGANADPSQPAVQPVPGAEATGEQGEEQPRVRDPPNIVMNACVESQDYELAQLLLEKRVGLNVANSGKDELILSAVVNSDAAMIEMLLAYGAAVTERVMAAAVEHLTPDMINVLQTFGESQQERRMNETIATDAEGHIQAARIAASDCTCS